MYPSHISVVAWVIVPRNSWGILSRNPRTVSFFRSAKIELYAAFRFAAIMARMGGQMKYYELLPADHDFEWNNLATTVLGNILGELGVQVSR